MLSAVRTILLGAVAPSFDLPLLTSLVPNKATGSSTPTFTRATTAYVTDFEGLLKPVLSGEARFNGARRVRNLTRWSQDLSNGAWTCTAPTSVSVTSNSAVAPDGSSTADTLVCLAVLTDNHHKYETVVTAAGTFTFSIYLKNAGYNFAYVTPTVGAGGGFFVNLTTGAVTGTVGGTTAVVESAGNGWWRCSATRTLSAGNQNSGFYVFDNVAGTSFTGDGVSGVYAWGMQFENVTGQTVTSASEYVSVDVLSAPYHGAGVDAVKYFSTTLSGAAINSSVAACAGGVAAGVVDAVGPVGYLAEGARTNLCLQSQTFGTTWAPLGLASVTENQIAAPDGTTTADLLTEDTGTSRHIVYQGVTVSLGVTYAYSVFAKKGTQDRIILKVDQAGTNAAGIFNLNTGVVGNSGGATASIESAGNGWYRCIIVYVADGAGAKNLHIGLADNDTFTASNESSYTGASKTVYIWGAQLE